uniref:Vesicle-fusing ATPase n=1 Tax=Alexandrium catenella TaxID=2925 RepID=A0A7S1S480_ALECA
MARENKPSIIFIDEVDSLCGARGESGESDAGRRIKTEFLAQMDGVGKDTGQLLVLGATNTPWDLDTAIRRRFEKRIYIPLPEAEARTTMLKLHLGKTPHELTQGDMTAVASRAEGFSGADISILVRDAIFEPVRRCRRAKTFKRVQQPGADGVMKQYWTPCSPGDPAAVEMSLMDVPGEELLEPKVLASDFEVALGNCRPSVSPGDLKAHQDFTNSYGMEG